MRIAIAMVQVPFTKGGAEIHADMLKNELVKRGHIVDIVTVPFKWYPGESLVDSMMIGRLMDLTEINGETIDRVIAMKFPAFYVKHPNKVLWLLHQHRQAYDLWSTEYGDLKSFPDGEKIRNLIMECDKKYISEAKRVFTNAQNTANRLKQYCGIDSKALYHPPLNYEKLHCESYGDYVFYPSRIDAIKRQRLLVEAARYMETPARIVLAGAGSEAELAYINGMIEKYKLHDRVTLAGFISEEEKINYYANSLCVYFGAYDEDYGYITLEAFFSEKPVVVHYDAGGPLEFVENAENGYIIENKAECIAKKIDYLYNHRDEAAKMGQAGKKSLQDKHMDWDYVINELINE